MDLRLFIFIYFMLVPGLIVIGLARVFDKNEDRNGKIVGMILFLIGLLIALPLCFV